MNNEITIYLQFGGAEGVSKLAALSIRESGETSSILIFIIPENSILIFFQNPSIVYCLVWSTSVLNYSNKGDFCKQQ